MNTLIVKVDENDLIRSITTRVYCKNEFEKTIALSFAVRILEQAEFINVRECNEAVEEEYPLPVYAPFKVSFSVLYKDEEARKKFLELLKNYA